MPGFRQFTSKDSALSLVKQSVLPAIPEIDKVNMVGVLNAQHCFLKRAHNHLYTHFENAVTDIDQVDHSSSYTNPMSIHSQGDGPVPGEESRSSLLEQPNTLTKIRQRHSLKPISSPPSSNVEIPNPYLQIQI